MYSWQVKDYNACRKDIWMLGMGYLELNMIAQCAIIWISLTCLNCVKSNCDFSFNGKLYRRWRPNFWPLPFYFTVNITQPRHRLNRRCYQIWPKIFPLYHIMPITFQFAMFISRYSQDSHHQSIVPHDSRGETLSLRPLLNVNRVRIAIHSNSP